MAELTGEAFRQQVQLEKDNLDPSYENTLRLLNAELGADKSKSYITIHQNKGSRLAVKVILPVKEYPQVNFTGRLLGPGGANLKAMQDQTGCKMSILGRGSMRDKAKEEELRQQGGKNAHLNEDLHVLVECFNYPLPEAYTYLGYALAELRKYLGAEFDQNQAFVGLPQAANGSSGGRGAPARSGLLPTRGRGGPPGPPRGAPGMAPRGARGAPTPRARGIPPRGRGHPAAAAAYADPYAQAVDPYAGYGGVEVAEQEDPYGLAASGYEDQTQYTGYEEYDASAYSDPSQAYTQAAVADPSQQYYADYSQYATPDAASYDSWGTAASAYGKAPSPVAIRGARGGHPYAHARGARGARR